MFSLLLKELIFIIITNYRFADEAGVLVDRLDTTTTRYKMEISPDKTKVMTNNPVVSMLPKRDQDKRLEVRRSGKLKVP